MSTVFLTIKASKAKMADEKVDGKYDPNAGSLTYTGTDYDDEQVWAVNTNADNFSSQNGFAQKYKELFKPYIAKFSQNPARLDNLNVYRKCLDPNSHHYSFSVSPNDLERIFNIFNGSFVDGDGNTVSAETADEFKGKLAQADGTFIVHVKFQNTRPTNEESKKLADFADFAATVKNRELDPDWRTLVRLSKDFPYEPPAKATNKGEPKQDIGETQLKPGAPLITRHVISDPLDRYPARWLEVFTDAPGAVQEIPARIIQPYGTINGLDKILNNVALEGEGYDWYDKFLHGLNGDFVLSRDEIEAFKAAINKEPSGSFFSIFSDRLRPNQGMASLYNAEQRQKVTKALTDLLTHLKTLRVCEFTYPTTKGRGLRVRGIFDGSQKYYSNDLEITDGSGKLTIMRHSRVYNAGLHADETGNVKPNERGWTFYKNELGLDPATAEGLTAAYERHKDLGLKESAAASRP